MGNFFLVFVVLVFVAVILLFQGLYTLWNVYRGPEAQRIQSRLRNLAAGGIESSESRLVKERLRSELPLLDRLFLTLPRIHELDAVLRQSGVDITPARFAIVSTVGGLVALAIGALAGMPIFLTIALGVGATCIPLVSFCTSELSACGRWRRCCRTRWTSLPEPCGPATRSRRHWQWSVKRGRNPFVPSSVPRSTRLIVEWQRRRRSTICRSAYPAATYASSSWRCSFRARRGATWRRSSITAGAAATSWLWFPLMLFWLWNVLDARALGRGKSISTLPALLFVAIIMYVVAWAFTNVRVNRLFERFEAARTVSTKLLNPDMLTLSVGGEDRICAWECLSKYIGDRLAGRTPEGVLRVSDNLLDIVGRVKPVRAPPWQIWLGLAERGEIVNNFVAGSMIETIAMGLMASMPYFFPVWIMEGI